MGQVRDHESVWALGQRMKACTDATTVRHVQVIWLLAQGHSCSQVSAMTAFSERWVQEVLERYNAEGPDVLGDGRRRNGRSATILTPAVLDALRTRIMKPPPDGGVWSSRKVAAFLAQELGVKAVAPQRGWEALQAIGWSLQRPRPRDCREFCARGHRMDGRGPSTWRSTLTWWTGFWLAVIRRSCSARTAFLTR